ncbi:hypothetical protein [Pseudomonas massiliensis]|uniref:hypothetical protein n=1 Tax=Pseudomonas massiliensis TaxID=522492 RepID=UPI00058F1059|nr:hypothetical protein [Pseudomonas massiliensis]
MFQELRELRMLRLEHDRGFGTASLFVVALEMASGELYVYLPPGNEDFTKLYGAQPCDTPVFGPDTLRLMSEEAHPAQPPQRVMAAHGKIIEHQRFDAPCAESLKREPDSEP